jgi:hypothetical protein
MSASKGPLNYTTSIDPGTTAAECLAILAKHGASAVAIQFNCERQPDGISFVIETPYGERAFTLPVNVAGTQKALQAAYGKRLVERRHTTPEHARRVAWRVMKAWIEAQLALIEAGLADLAEIMLPWMKVDGELTMWDAYRENERKALAR